MSSADVPRWAKAGAVAAVVAAAIVVHRTGLAGWAHTAFTLIAELVVLMAAIALALTLALAFTCWASAYISRTVAAAVQKAVTELVKQPDAPVLMPALLAVAAAVPLFAADEAFKDQPLTRFAIAVVVPVITLIGTVFARKNERLETAAGWIALLVPTIAATIAGVHAHVWDAYRKLPTNSQALLVCSLVTWCGALATAALVARGGRKTTLRPGESAFPAG